MNYKKYLHIYLLSSLFFVLLASIVCLVIINYKGNPDSSSSKTTSDKVLCSALQEQSPIQTYTREDCEILEMVYGKNMMSEGGEKAIDFMIGSQDLGGKSVLDFGSGIGGVSYYLASKHKVQIVGVDLSPIAIEISKQNAPKESKNKILFQLIHSNHRLPFDDESFDLILAKGVFMIMDPKDREASLQEFYRILRPGGRVVIDEWLEDCKDYKSMLAKIGFTNITFTDRSLKQKKYWKDILRHLKNSKVKNDIVRKFDEDQYQDIVDVYNDNLKDLQSYRYGIFKAIKEKSECHSR